MQAPRLLWPFFAWFEVAILSGVHCTMKRQRKAPCLGPAVGEPRSSDELTSKTHNNNNKRSFTDLILFHGKKRLFTQLPT